MNHVLVATPSYDDKVTSSYMSSIIEYLAHTNVNVSYTILPFDSLITRMRNSLFTTFYENMDSKDLTHILWQDSDVYVQGYGLERMLSIGVDVIGPAIPIKIPVSPYGISCAVSYVYEEVEPFLYKARYLGTGAMMLSKKAVIDLVEYCEKNNQWYYDPREDRKIYDIFRVGIDKDKIYQSEDWYLCDILNNLGYEIYVDSGSNTSHMNFQRRMMQINPESINRRYSSELNPQESNNFWTPNDWLSNPFDRIDE